MDVVNKFFLAENIKLDEIYFLVFLTELMQWVARWTVYRGG